MGISGNQFWASSENGKAMLIFLAQRGDIELVRDACDWLVVERRKGLVTKAKQQGANDDQAKLVATNAVAGLEKMVASLNDRSATATASAIVDAVFHDHFAAGTQQYKDVMLWLAKQLRERIQD